MLKIIKITTAIRPTVWGEESLAAKRYKLPLNAFIFLIIGRGEIEFTPTHAYSNLGITVYEYKINKLSRVENGKSNIANETQTLIGLETYNYY